MDYTRVKNEIKASINKIVQENRYFESLIDINDIQIENLERILKEYGELEKGGTK